MTETRPTPATWTVRLKNKTKTILVFADPLQSVDDLKEDLLRALRATERSGILNGVPIPNKRQQVVLGRPKDVYDQKKGWTNLEANLDEAAAGRGRTPRAATSSLKGLGLTDNPVLAFKFISDRLAEDGSRHDTIGAFEEDNDEDWDVVIPSYEDLYGVENSSDVGARKEYRG